MSRNNELRKAAAKLPPVYKKDKLGKPIFDEWGRQIQVDHFKQMVDIKQKVEDDFGPVNNESDWNLRNKIQLQAIGTYSEGVLDLYKKKRLKLLSKILMWAMAITTWIVLAVYYFLM